MKNSLIVIALAAGAATADDIPLTYNWNGLAHAAERAQPTGNDPDGFRSISDRALIQGTTDSLGGTDGMFSTAGAFYQLETGDNALDLLFIGLRAASGGPPWDDVVDNDSLGVAPNWDPTAGTGSLDTATSTFPSPIPMISFSAIGVIYHGAENGGAFDVTLHFDDATSVTVTLDCPDWFANFDPNPAAPGPGVESQTTLSGPLSGGDGFLASSSIDSGNPGDPLSLFEAIISGTELMNDLGFDIDGKSLVSMTFDKGALGPSASVGIYALSVDGLPAALEYNWNGMLQGAEIGTNTADRPDGYRSISDRGFTVGGATSVGGTGFQVDTTDLSYGLNATADVPDLVFIGDKNMAWDDVVDADAWGVAPNWDPTGGTAVLGSASSNFAPVALNADSTIGILSTGSNGGGDWLLTLGFSDGTSVGVLINTPDWFANFDPVPNTTPGVASATTVVGPLNGGDGFEGTFDDTAAGSADLSVFEHVMTTASILNDLAFDMDGKMLDSLTFDATGFLNPGVAVGVIAAAVDSGEVCLADWNGDGIVNTNDFLAYLNDYNSVRAGGSFVFHDPDLAAPFGVINTSDFLAFLNVFNAGCP